ncbi:polysaccharide deacetylase family protein [Jidongwangia harbinensis]|uniref:polysaccharide deacetylase family protein n=1 Tax=Jidongwangia harbinensis TaxID=2878561 RepID=UPI001CDA0A77|nr:polysaccharide deacetylase family protein [Jidongwangia harbinensis]MCA2219286.1 polysaccharide deacetylase family protein [Jidongwangia harbinensis]
MAQQFRIARPSRRAVLRSALLLGAGAGAGAVGANAVPAWCGWDRPPLGGGYAAAVDSPAAVRHAEVSVRYYVETTEPVVAFTFDDGPGPHWTPMVLDTLDAAQVPATFFMVGRNLAAHAGLVRGRLDRHEVGNHSWSHDDLATLDLRRVRTELSRTHEAIQEVTGRAPRLLRPPYGHLGGSTLLAADSMGYHIALWSQQMRERAFAADPHGQVRAIVDAVRPGDIILAHDVGADRRLLALRQLGAMIEGIRARGFRFATVSGLVAAGTRNGAAQRTSYQAS